MSFGLSDDSGGPPASLLDGPTVCVLSPAPAEPPLVKQPLQDSSAADSEQQPVARSTPAGPACGSGASTRAALPPVQPGAEASLVEARELRADLSPEQLQAIATTGLITVSHLKMSNRVFRKATFQPCRRPGTTERVMPFYLWDRSQDKKRPVFCPDKTIPAIVLPADYYEKPTTEEFASWPVEYIKIDFATGIAAKLASDFAGDDIEDDIMAYLAKPPLRIRDSKARAKANARKAAAAAKKKNKHADIDVLVQPVSGDSGGSGSSHEAEPEPDRAVRAVRAELGRLLGTPGVPRHSQPASNKATVPGLVDVEMPEPPPNNHSAPLSPEDDEDDADFELTPTRRNAATAQQAPKRAKLTVVTRGADGTSAAPPAVAAPVPSPLVPLPPMPRRTVGFTAFSSAPNSSQDPLFSVPMKPTPVSSQDSNGGPSSAVYSPLFLQPPPSTTTTAARLVATAAALASVATVATATSNGRLLVIFDVDGLQPNTVRLLHEKFGACGYEVVVLTNLTFESLMQLYFSTVDPLYSRAAAQARPVRCLFYIVGDSQAGVSLDAGNLVRGRLSFGGLLMVSGRYDTVTKHPQSWIGILVDQHRSCQADAAQLVGARPRLLSNTWWLGAVSRLFGSPPSASGISRLASELCTAVYREKPVRAVAMHMRERLTALPSDETFEFQEFFVEDGKTF